MGRPRKNAVILKPEQVQRLSVLVNARRTAQTVARQEMILLLCNQGMSDTAIASELHITQVTIGDCVSKFQQMGLDAAVGELARSGQPRVIDDKAKAWMLDLACSRPYDHGSAQESWSIALLAQQVRRTCVQAGHPALANAGKSLIHGILNEGPFAIKPHEVRYYLEKRDPEFEQKLRTVLLVYKEVSLCIASGGCSDASQNQCVVILYDEKPGM